MKYRIRDRQFECRYYADGAMFATKGEIRRDLISYHSADNGVAWLNKLSLDEICEFFCWEIEEVKENYGVFAYDKKTDEHLEGWDNYFEDREEAIAYAKQIIHEDSKFKYVEVWEKPEDGLWGNTGEPIYKSDEVKNGTTS